MGRPKTPLIEKSDAIAKALEIIDAEGIDALSIRRLGKELGVNGASLYHHFSDKEEILDGVRRLVLQRLQLPSTPEVDWQDFVLRSALRFREALLAHPNTAPLMVASGRRPIGIVMRDFTAARLLEADIPPKYVFALSDSAETLAFGSAMMNPHNVSPHDRLGEPGEAHPSLRLAVRAASRSAEKAFRLQVEALIEGWSARIEKERVTVTKPRTRTAAR